MGDQRPFLMAATPSEEYEFACEVMAIFDEISAANQAEFEVWERKEREAAAETRHLLEALESSPEKLNGPNSRTTRNYESDPFPLDPVFEPGSRTNAVLSLTNRESKLVETHELEDDDKLFELLDMNQIENNHRIAQRPQTASLSTQALENYLALHEDSSESPSKGHLPEIENIKQDHKLGGTIPTDDINVNAAMLLTAKGDTYGGFAGISSAAMHQNAVVGNDETSQQPVRIGNQPEINIRQQGVPANQTSLETQLTGSHNKQEEQLLPTLEFDHEEEEPLADEFPDLKAEEEDPNTLAEQIARRFIGSAHGDDSDEHHRCKKRKSDSNQIYDLLNQLRRTVGEGKSKIGVEELPPRLARTVPSHLVFENGKVRDFLIKKGPSELYLHQAIALELLKQSQHVILATPTASGKSLVYILHILQLFTSHRSGIKKKPTSLLVYPLKALAHDQMQKIKSVFTDAGGNARIDIYDGDTDQKKRSTIRNQSHIVLTNPDMLHLIVAQHTAWSSFLARLEFVAVDESHVYAGVFGSQFAMVLKRFLKVCHHYKSRPQFLFCSGTIANPREHAVKLLGRKVEMVHRKHDGSPSGARVFAFWNPELKEIKVPGGSPIARRNTAVETTGILAGILKHSNKRSICFVKSRVMGEVLTKFVQDKLQADNHANLIPLIENYRSGYTADERRVVEKRLFSGKLRSVVATSALELGIDIGNLEITVLMGFPGSVSSFWQQVGRSGRGNQSSLVIYVGTDAATDQYYMNHASSLLGMASERITFTLSNKYVIKDHLLCFLSEMTPDDRSIEKMFGAPGMAVLRELASESLVRAIPIDSRMLWTYSPAGCGSSSDASSIYGSFADGVASHAFSFSIRDTASKVYKVVEKSTGKLIEEVDGSRACSVCYKGAVLLHQRESYLIVHVDFVARKAFAIKPNNIGYYTEPKIEFRVENFRAISMEEELGIVKTLGMVSLHTKVAEYRKLKYMFYGDKDTTPEFSNTVFGVDFPAYSYETMCTVLVFGISLLNELYNLKGCVDPERAIEGCCYLLDSCIPLVISCESRDVRCFVAREDMMMGGVGDHSIIQNHANNNHNGVGVDGGMRGDAGLRNAIVIADTSTGGNGISESVFGKTKALLLRARDVVFRCPCVEGCPSCVLPKMKARSFEPDKKGTQLVLNVVLRRVMDGVGRKDPL